MPINNTNKNTDTDIMITQNDLGQNLYRKRTYYTVIIEQDVLAKDQEEADILFQDSGIDHSKITKDITEENGNVQTYYVDANYADSDPTTYIGKVNFDPMDDEAQENGDVIIDDMAPENIEQDKEYDQERANHIAKSQARGEL
jgi:hypothetical protein